MSYQYIGSFVFALVLIFIFERKQVGDILNIKKYYLGSILISIFGVLGGYFILKALSLGTLYGVYAIQPAYIFVAGFLGHYLFKEEIAKKKILLAMLTVVGIIILRLGSL